MPYNDSHGQGIAVGVCMAWAGANPPQGWLKTDGTAVSRMEYPALFNVIGTKYGVGDGSTTFTLPNIAYTSTSTAKGAKVTVTLTGVIKY